MITTIDCPSSKSPWQVAAGVLLLPTALVSGMLVTPSAYSQAYSYSVLHLFTGSDGANPRAGLARDKAGNLYGTTADGGNSNLGVVFKLDTADNETVLHNFAGGATDGANPYAGVILDANGNLYGTTFAGGPANSGVIFKLKPSGTERLLYKFTGGADGSGPYYGYLVRDLAGNLYGTTYLGGDFSCLDLKGCGVVFKLTPSGTESALHSFAYNPPNQNDGAYPLGGVSRDSAGNLYGSANGGGGSGGGMVFKLDSFGNETPLHEFHCADINCTQTMPDGVNPYATVIRDAAGNLYGTTSGESGLSGFGVVFKINASGNESLLHVFAGPPSDGAAPIAGLIRDGAGNLYGTTSAGGTFGNGSVFKIDQYNNLTLLYSFTGGTDGSTPIGGLIRDTAGNLYGTTFAGGVGGTGVVFKLGP